MCLHMPFSKYCFFVEVPFSLLYISSMLQSRDDLLQGFSDESADDELENLLRRKLNKSKYFLLMKSCPKDTEKRKYVWSMKTNFLWKISTKEKKFWLNQTKFIQIDSLEWHPLRSVSKWKNAIIANQSHCSIKFFRGLAWWLFHFNTEQGRRSWKRNM